MTGARETIAVVITFRKFDKNSLNRRADVFRSSRGGGGKHPVPPLLLMLRLLLVSPNVSRECSPMTQCTMTQCTTTLLPEMTHACWNTAYNSVHSFARAKVNNIGVGQREVGGLCLGGGGSYT